LGTCGVSEIHPGAEILASARTDLMATARVALDLGGDVAAAAEALRVHRTRLYYRLDRVQELTGVDLRAGVGRTDLQLALWLAAYRRAGGLTPALLPSTSVGRTRRSSALAPIRSRGARTTVSNTSKEVSWLRPRMPW
jgi:hypothetical protein